VASNTIVLENQKPGTPKSVWDAPASNQIEGFATQISVDNGSTVSFKINLNVSQSATAPYHIEIYRLGYYGGDGATLVTTLNNLTGRAQPNPITDSRGLVDAGNWSVSASWQTPETAVSGVYLAKLVRDDNGATNQIPFIVRDDGGTSDIVLQTSDTTWQAYNGWAGRNGQVGGSLYGGFDQPANIAPDQAPGDQDRAFAVSYNRPFIVRDGGGTYAGGQDYLFGADYSAIYFLEKNGYDVSYISGVDTDRLGVGNLTNHLAYISVGHDEYWSGDQRANVEAARDAGVNLLFWSGNEVYWKTRWETSIVDGTPFRTLVTYKETKFNYSLDAGPSDYPNVDPSTQWTGTWRDTRFVGNPNAVGARPENSLTGQLFVADGTGEFGGALDIPAAFAGLRVWRDTGVGPNGAQNLAPGIIGYEWDISPDDAFRPPSLIKLSETNIPWSAILTDEGNRTEAGTATHNLSLYRDDSGALVFGAGTVFWSWGLSNQHDNSPYGANIETRALQQFTVNMLADMGIQPQVADAILASQGLVRASATNDHIAATATLNNLPDTVGANSTVTISGTAADIDNNPSNADGRVAVVEVSVDNGQTWRVAQGTTNWSFNWTPTVQGTYTVRVRAIDDSLNVLPNNQLASDVVTVGTAQPPDTVSLFGSAAATGTLGNDGAAVELGMKFVASTGGTVTALRYWRGSGDAGDTDVRQGHLWTSSGQLLGTATFTSTAGQSGWQTATLSTPISLTAGQTYIVSYKSDGNYTAQTNYFNSTVTEPFGVLSAPSSGASAGNGIYGYGADAAVFPNLTYQASNYWVDVVFDPGGAPPTSPQVALTTSSVTHAEGNSGLTTFDYTVTRTGSTTGTSTVAWTVAGSGASPANAADFQGGQLPAGTVTFAAGETSKVITVSVVGDTTNEPNETFSLTLSNPSGATLGTAVATGVITNDDGTTPPPTTPSLFGAAAASGSMTNDGLAVELGMKFTASAAGQVTGLRYWRSAGDAGDTDVRDGHLWSSTGQLLGTVTFTSTAGQSGWQVANLATPVTLTAGTTYIVSYKTADNFHVALNYFTSSVTDATGQLTAPSSAASGGNGVFAYGAGAVFPNETYQSSNYWADVVFAPGTAPPPSPQVGLTTTSVTHAEGNSGLTTFDYTVTRTGDTTGASAVSWAVTGSGGSPATAADFQGGVLPSGTVNFAAGETSKTITVSVVGDTTNEPDETFALTLSDPSGATLGTAVATGVITNDDSAPTSPQIALTTTSVSHAEGNSGVTTFDYTVTRTGTTTGASTASWAVAGSGASPANAADFQGGVLPSGTVTFAAGETSKVITVSVLGDTINEPNETFSLTLSNPSGATLGTAVATGVITNDDGTPPTAVSLFGATAATGSLENDNQSVELGMKFSASAAGQITALRYWRAAGDANDTDVRQGHLWSSTGQLLGTVTFTSTAGQSGWQTANLATPVNLTAGATYVVSYKTANNYIAQTDYFTSGVTDATGQLTAPSSAAGGGNGVYVYGTATAFPNQTYSASNYWVDVVFTGSGGGGNQAPVANNDNFSTGEATALNGNVVANDSDPNGTALTVTAVNGVAANVGSAFLLASGARLTVNASGAFTYDPNGAFNALNTGQTATDSFTYTVSDGALTSSATSTITINGVSPAGGQTLTGTTGANTLTGGAGADSISGLAGADQLNGGDGADTINGGDGLDLINGGSGADSLLGAGGADTLVGGAGADSLNGNAGADVFRWAAFSESTAAAPDVVMSFEGAGATGGDRIDVSALSAGVFAFNGTGAFSGGGTPSIRYVTGGGVTEIQFDDGSGGAPEMIVRLNSVVSLNSGDFIL